MKKIYILFFMLLLVTICFAQNFEGFETGNFLSYNWQFLGSEDWEVTVANSYQGAFCASSGDVEDDEFSRIQISLETIEPGDVSFYWKVNSELDGDLLKFYLDNDEITSISGTEDWHMIAEFIDPGLHTFAWSYEKNSFGLGGVDKGWIDSITFPATTTYPNDLAALSVVGPSTLYQGHAGVYNVHVKNYGSNDQDNYTVRLYREGGLLLDELVITDVLYSEEAIIHQLVWIVPPDEPYAQSYVYAEVILADDEDPANNTTDDYDVIILELGLAQIRVGFASDKTNWYPFKFHMPASLAETMYYPVEIPYSGNIHAIGYQNDFVSYVSNADIQIWMGETNVGSLAGGWIGAGSLDQVFDGTFSFPMGNNSVIIPLDEPYEYTGSNLCVLTHRVYDTNTFHVNDEFMETEATSIYFDRTLAMGSNSPINPNNPTGGYIFSRYPNTTFYMEVTNVGNVEGHVYDELGNTISTADIVLQQYNTHTVSNGSGFYQYGNVLEGNYTFTASKTGYESDSEPGIVTTGNTIVIDFTLQTIPTVEITGHLVASDDLNTGLENAVLNLYGNEDYQVQSDGNGNFIFSGVLENDNYTLAIQKFGYENYTDDITVVSSNVDLGTIVLEETAFPADDLIGMQNLQNTEISLSWNAPFALTRDFESYRLYRFLESEIGTPDNWILLAENYVDTAYVDTEWTNLPDEDYQYAVIACYAAGIESLPEVSNVLERISVESDINLISLAKTGLQSIFPNPFNPETTISYMLIGDSKLQISIYNVKGQLIKTLVNSREKAGKYSVTWNGTDENHKNQSSGIYLIRLQEDGKTTSTRKCILMK